MLCITCVSGMIHGGLIFCPIQSHLSSHEHEDEFSLTQPTVWTAKAHDSAWTLMMGRTIFGLSAIRAAQGRTELRHPYFLCSSTTSEPLAVTALKLLSSMTSELPNRPVSPTNTASSRRNVHKVGPLSSRLGSPIYH